MWWSKFLRHLREIDIWRIICFINLMYVVPAYAAPLNVGNLNAGSMIEHLAKQIPQLMQMVTAIAYVLGMYMMVQGIIKMKHLGEARTMMTQEHSIKGPLVYFASGALLLYLPTSVQVGMSTFWTDPNPYGYLQQQDQWQSFINNCFLVVQFVGTIAFIRGILILSHTGDRGGQPGQVSKGMTHIIGGIFCINIYQFVQVIMVTFGIQT